MAKVEGWRPRIRVYNKSGRSLQVTAAYDETNKLVVVNIYGPNGEAGLSVRLDTRQSGEPTVKLIKAGPNRVRVSKEARGHG